MNDAQFRMRVLPTLDGLRLGASQNEARRREQYVRSSQWISGLQSTVTQLHVKQRRPIITPALHNSSACSSMFSTIYTYAIRER